MRPPWMIVASRAAGLRTLCAAAALFVTSFSASKPLVAFDDVAPAKLTATAPASRLRERRVPVSQLKRWTERGWRRIGRDEYRTLRAIHQSTTADPQPVWIRTAEYAATLSNRSLVGGRFTAEIGHDGTRLRRLRLDPLNLAITDLTWADGKDKQAVWGTAPRVGNRTSGEREEGEEIILLVEGNNKRLAGRFHLEGRTISRGIEFHLHIPPAVVSRFRLTLPTGQTPTASVGDVSGPLATDRPEWKLWTLNLGSRSNCILTVNRTGHPASTKPLILNSTDTTYVIRREGLQLQTRFELEVLRSPVKQLTFALPKNIRVRSITYDGETSLSWKSAPSAVDGNQKVVVHLPDPLLRRSRRIRILADGPVETEKSWTLPMPTLSDAVFVMGQVHLKIEKPLQLLQVESMRGFRQTATLSEPVAGETLSYQQFRSNARLTVHIGFPRLDLQALVLNHLEVDADKWLLTSEVKWTARSGSTFTTECLLSPRWDVIEISTPTGTDHSKLASREVIQQQNGSKRIKLEFRDALSPSEPKTVWITARRVPSAVGRPSELPILRPLNTGSVSGHLAAGHPPTSLVRLDASSGYERLDTSDLPSHVEATSALWKDIVTNRKGREVSLFSFGASASGEISIESAEPSLDADARVTLDLEADRFVEHFSANIVPKTDPIGRVFAYLSSTGQPLVWKLETDDRAKLESTRLAASRHADWGLPPTGELWEIRLPQLQDRAFRVSATRSGTIDPNIQPALLFVAGSREFRGTVLLRAPAGVEFETSTQGLLSGDAERAETANNPQSDSKRQPRIWHYDTPAARLSLRFHQGEASDHKSLIAALRLESILGSDGNWDIHWARFDIETGFEPASFRFRLPDDALLIEVTVNGEVVSPTQIGSEMTLPAAAETSAGMIVIHYRTAAEPTAPIHRREIVLPHSSCVIVDFQWKLALGPDMRLSSDPQGVVTGGSFAALPWSQRYFGPLGRPLDTRVFNPLSAGSWKNLIAPDVNQRHPTDSFKAGNFPPAGWKVIHATAGHPPERLILETWNISTMRLVGWIGMLICLLAGVTLRLAQIENRRKIIAIWLGFSLIAAWLAPPAYALVAGGCLAGSLIAIGLPSRLLIRRKQADVLDNGVPMGSTVSLHHIAETLLPLIFAVALATCGTQNLTAQDEKTSPPRFSNGAERADVSTDVYDVLVPEFDPSSREKDFPFVYLHESVLADLRAFDKARQNRGDYLFVSAEYRATIDENHSATIEAHYRIAVPQSHMRTKVKLPITNANFGSPDDCLVNGTPHPILVSDDGSGYVIELSGNEEHRPIAARKPEQESTGSPSSDGSKSLRDQTAGSRLLLESGSTRMFDVVLRLRPPTLPIAGGGGFKIGIPRIASSTLLLTFDRDYAAVNVSGSLNEPVTRKTGDTFHTSVNLGPTGVIQAIWSSRKRPVQPAAALEATVTCLVDARPTLLDMHYRVAYRPSHGPVDFVVWNIPGNMIVRKVTDGSNSLRYWIDSDVGDGDGKRLFIDFAASQTNDFIVEAKLSLPVHSPSDEIQVPAVELLNTGPAGAQLKVTLNQIGIWAPDEFLLTPNIGAGKPVVAVSADSFLAAAEAPGNAMRKPLYAFRIERPTLLPFSLTLVTPRRKVRRLENIGTISSSRLNWKFTAEIETDDAPAFGHTLIVDPNLIIESISVREDEAQRLVRFSRDGRNIHLFLSNKTTGLQVLELQGYVPIQLETATPLPIIRFADADATPSNLRLYRAEDIGVELVDFKSIERLDEPMDRPADKKTYVPIGKFRVSAGASQSKIRLHRQSDPGRVDLVTLIERKSDGRWALSTTLRFHADSQDTSEFRVHIPADLADVFRPQLADAESFVELRDDGSHILTVKPKQKVADDFNFTVSAVVAAPAGEWQLPVVTPIDARSGSHYLLVSPPGRFVPASTLASKLDTRALPKWLASATAFDPNSSKWDAYAGNSLPWKLVRKGTNESSGEAHIPLMHTQYWLAPDATVHGRTVITLVSKGENRLVFRWPENTQLTGALLDGKSLEPLSAATGQLSFLIGPSPEPRTIVVLWTKENRETVPRFGTWSVDVPTPIHTHVEHSLYTLVPPTGVRFTPRTDFERMDRLSFNLDRLEGLLEAVQDALDSLPGPSGTFAALVQLQEALDEELGSNGATQSTQAASLEQRERFAGLHEEVEAVRRSVAPDPASINQADESATAMTTQALLVEPPAEPNHGLLFARGESESGGQASLSVWVIDEGALNWLLLVLGLAVLIPVLLFASRIDPGIRLRRGHAVLCLLWGLVWWVCLTPSFAGPLLVILAAILAMVPRNHGKVESEVAGPAG